MGGSGMIYGNPLRGYEDNRVGPLTQVEVHLVVMLC